MQFLILIIGFVLLIKGADIFVEGASSIAKKFNVPPMLIGLTIVAMGTSAPEAAVSISSSLAGQNDMSIANVVGSNFFNILIVLGVSAIIAKLPVQKDTIKKDTPFLIFISALLVVFCFGLKLSRFEGLILLTLFVVFLINTIKSNLNQNNNEVSSGETAIAIEIPDSDSKSVSMPKTLLICLVGIIGIVFGGDLVVDSASSIATSFGMSANLVGLTIVAMGTSLPEFVTSVIAVRKGETDIAIGNVIGSNIFNILLVLGLAAIIHPMAISLVAFIDTIFMTAITILLYIFIKKNNSLSKAQGILFIIIYFAYMTYTIMR
ncbi:calcium/proton exchanger [[Clostridium] sordellii]|uniref:calcium/sodium antiporter n=1 Tax=Paraclostridium sordellii TaxID=1505 RepID=UPI0005DF8E7A|nr:calcium/sodium antiporter [Paeniclostridium sordellii]MBX9181583.1 calcium/sodium antiporter [Paeniclostridium sordellii]CEO14791.1 calcium/proton exchanger [[Clostridium] sordellii] [Paeniclostridium sordellii]CEP83208.1 calcium/proton exchanger [[Clostridium] sordellii] [Paeniclostridium sordellii]